jgi:hypothetical protein
MPFKAWRRVIMKKRMLIAALIAAGVVGGAYAQVDQYWNGMATSAGWATTNTGWGSTSDYGGTDVNDSWTNGNNAVMEADPSNRQILEDLTVNQWNYTAGSDHAFQADAGPVTITVLDSVNMTGLGNVIVNDSTTMQGSFTVTAANTTLGVNDSRLAFNNDTTLAAGTVTISGVNAARIQMNGTSTLTGNIILGGGNASLGIRWNAGVNQTMGTLSGSGYISSNPGGGHSAYDTQLTVNKLEIGTDGTLGTINSLDQGANNIYVLDLAAGSTNQFDISKSGATLTNDYVNLNTGFMGMDVDGAVIRLSHNGDALVLGDKFTLITSPSITGTPVIDDTAAAPPVDTAWAYINGEVELISTTDTTPPAAPTDLSANGGFYTVALDWTDHPNPDGDLASYSVYRSQTSTTWPGDFSVIASNIVSSSYDDNSVGEENSTYYYRVTALDLSGNESNPSIVATGITEVDDDPSAPDGLTAIGKFDEVFLVWNPNLEPEGDLASYNVYRSETSGSGHAIIASNVTVSSFSDTNVVNGTPYYYLVTAVDTHDNEGAASAEASATPDADTVLSDAQHLLDDWSFTTKPDTNMSTDTEGLKEEWRWHAAQLMCQLQSTEATSTTNDSSSFTAPVNLTNHTAITSDPGYDPATTKLEAIVPAFVGTSDLRNVGAGEFAGGTQELMAWYEITLATTGGTYTATSDEGNLFDPSGSISPIVAAWNRITWDSNPFANGGIPYNAITNVTVEFFHRTDTATTIAGASGWLNMYQAPIEYYVTLDRLGDEYTGSLYIGNGTDATTNNPVTWNTVSTNWAFGSDGTYATWTNWVNGANAVIIGDGVNSRIVNLATNLNVTVNDLVWDTDTEAVQFFGVSNSTETITVTNEIRTALGETARQFDLYQLTLGGQFNVQNVSRLIFQGQSGVATGTEITFLDASDIQFNGSKTDFSELSVSASGSLVYNQSAVDKTLGTLSGNGEIRLVAGAGLTINSISADEAGFAANANSAGGLELGSGSHILTINSDNGSAGTLAIGPGTITLGGTLVVSDIGSAELSLGDSFQIIDAGSYAGSFSSVTLPTGNLPSGGVWYNDLEKNGTISVGTADSRYEVFNFTEFASAGWLNRQQMLSGSLSNDAGVVVTLTLDCNVGNFAGNTNYVTGVYNSQIAGVQVTTNGGASNFGNGRLDSYGSTNVQDVLNTADDETLRFTVSVSGTAVDAIALKSLRLDTFGLNEIAEFANAGGTVSHQDTGGSDTVSFGTGEVLDGLTELSKVNIGSWYLDATARAYVSGGATNDTAVSFDDVKFVVGYPKVTYNLWAIDNGLTGGDADSDADPDEDGFSNLYEYGLNGNPNDANDRGVWELGATEIGGTNYFEYVHAKRSAPNSDISYDLEETDNLQYVDFTNNIPDLVTIEGPSAHPDYNSVTNRIPTTDAARFLKLIIEQN